MTLLLALFTLDPAVPEPAAPLPAAVAPAPRPATPPDPTRFRCKVAGSVLLGLAGAAIVSMLSVVIYRAVTTPDQVTLEAGPRLGFGLSSVALTVVGSALLGYGLSSPPKAPAGPPASPTAALTLFF